MKNLKVKFKIYPVKLNFYFTGIIFLTIIFFGFFGLVESSEAATRFFYENYDDTPSEQTTMVGVSANSNFDHVGRTSGSALDGEHEIVAENYDGGAGYSHRINYGINGSGLLDARADIDGMTEGFYVSFWYRISTGYCTGMTEGYSHKMFRMWATNDTNQSNIVQEIHIYMPFTDIPWAMDSGPQGDPVSETPPPPGLNGSRSGFSWEPALNDECTADTFEWHHYEQLVQYDNPVASGNGAQSVWIDDNLVLAESNIQINVSETYSEYTRFSIPSNMTSNGNTAAYYIDEIEIWDGLPSSDTTPPSAPLGLSVS